MPERSGTPSTVGDSGDREQLRATPSPSTSRTRTDAWAVTAGSNGRAPVYGPLLHSANAGRTWTRLAVPSEGPLVTVDFTDDEVGYGLTVRGELLFTNNGGRSWLRVRTPAPISDICFVNDLIGWLVGGSNVYRYQDGEVTMSLPSTRWRYGVNFDPTVTLSCAGPAVWADRLYQVGVGQTEMALLSNVGAHGWRLVGSNVDQGPYLSRFSPWTNQFGVTDTRHAWFLGNCSACQEADVSLTWTDDGGHQFSDKLISSRVEDLQSLVASFVDSDHGWVLFSVAPGISELVATEDGGRVWRTVSVSAPESLTEFGYAGLPTIPTPGINMEATAEPVG